MTSRVWIYQIIVRKDHPLQSCWIWSQRPVLTPSYPETLFSLPACATCSLYCKQQAELQEVTINFISLIWTSCLVPDTCHQCHLWMLNVAQPLFVLCTITGSCMTGWRTVKELRSLFSFHKPQSLWFLSGPARKCLDHPLAMGSALTV